MKIGTGDIFFRYNYQKKEKRMELLSDKEGYENTKKYLLDKIATIEHYIRSFTNIEYRDIANLNRCITEKSLIRLVDLEGVNIDSIRRSLNMIVQINKELSKIEDKINKLGPNTVDEDCFRNVIAKFNNEISDEIVYKGYTFKIGCGLGVVRIRKVLTDKRIKKRINWNESNKKKKEILARGGIPYKVLVRDEEGNILEDNGGEYWHVYFTGAFDYLWYWSKNRNIMLNSAYYKFRPTIYNNTSKGGGLGNVNKLSHLKTSESELLKNYH